MVTHTSPLCYNDINKTKYLLSFYVIVTIMEDSYDIFFDFLKSIILKKYLVYTIIFGGLVLLILEDTRTIRKY